MADATLYGMRNVTGNDDQLMADVNAEFSQMQLQRNTFAQMWEETAELILPSHRNTFFYGAYNWEGVKKTDRQVDATGMLANHRFGSICDSLLTPRNMIWHVMTSEQPEIMKDRTARLWYEQATRAMFQHRYAPLANFSGQNQQVYRSLGAFGNGAIFIDQAVNIHGTPVQALRYKAIPLGELFLRENHQGLVDGFVRWFKLTAHQAATKWGADNLPEGLKTALDQKSTTRFNFLHRVMPRQDYDPGRLGVKGKAFQSVYISIEGQCVLEEGGYNSFPLSVARYEQAPGETYGRGPATMVLPALKTLNAEKTTFLKQGHKAADPAYLVGDDGLASLVVRPGAINTGGVNPDGKPLVHVLPTGEIQVTKEMMDEERQLINDAFLVSLFQILTETPTMSATEVLERTNEKGILLAPTVGQQQSEYLGPMIDRELDLMSELGLLPPMPDVIREARGDYHINYTSPLSRAMRAQEAAGFMRTLQVATEVVNVTQDPSILDAFDFDVAIPDIANIQSVPESWMADPKVIAQKRAARAQQAQRQAEIQAAPAAAAMMKAHAAVAKSGAGGPMNAVPSQTGLPVGGPQQ